MGGLCPKQKCWGSPQSVPMGKGKRWCRELLLGTKRSICASHKSAGVGQSGEKANPRDQAQAYDQKQDHTLRSDSLLG